MEFLKTASTSNTERRASDGAPLLFLCARAVKALLFAFSMLLLSVSAAAETVYMDTAAFVERTFQPQQPSRETLWLTSGVKDQARNILGRNFAPLRVRYWRDGSRTAWTFDEVGKERPITMGIVVEDGSIASISVLVYRESRGAEIRHPFFTEQYEGARLDELSLDKHIDGITGATMSVRAATRVARLALLLHKEALAQL